MSSIWLKAPFNSYAQRGVLSEPSKKLDLRTIFNTQHLATYFATTRRATLGAAEGGQADADADGESGVYLRRGINSTAYERANVPPRAERRATARDSGRCRRGRIGDDPQGMDEPDDDPDKERWWRIGLTTRGIVVVIFTERGHRTRTISARKAAPHEELSYHRQSHP